MCSRTLEQPDRRPEYSLKVSSSRSYDSLSVVQYADSSALTGYNDPLSPHYCIDVCWRPSPTTSVICIMLTYLYIYTFHCAYSSALTGQGRVLQRLFYSVGGVLGDFDPEYTWGCVASSSSSVLSSSDIKAVVVRGLLGSW